VFPDFGWETAQANQNENLFSCSGGCGAHALRNETIHGRPNMRTISTMAVATTIAISALSFAATPGAAKTAKAAPTTTTEHYCLSYEAGSECGFTSYAQCKEMAAGIGGECRQEAGDRTQGQGQPAHR
jgi:hypothetical protein